MGGVWVALALECADIVDAPVPGRGPFETAPLFGPAPCDAWDEPFIQPESIDSRFEFGPFPPPAL
jgi:hypothetical protein